MTDKKVKIEIIGDTLKLKQSLDSGLRSVKKFGSAIASALKVGTIAFGGLTAASALMIRSFATQEQVMNKTRAVIKSTGGAAGITAKEIFKMASGLQDVTKFGDEAIIQGQNLLLTFKNLGKDVFPAVTETMLDMSEAMGTDLKSSALQLGKALNDPTNGLSMLTRVGITFTDQQKEQIKALQESGDIVGAQTVMLAELQSQFAGTARAAAQGTGIYAQISNILGDVLEIGGKVVHEFLEPSAIQFKEFVKNAIDTGKVEAIFRKIAGAIKAVVDRITGFALGGSTASETVDKLSDKIGKLVDDFNKFIASISAESMKDMVDGFKAVIELAVSAAKATRDLSVAILNLKNGTFGSQIGNAMTEPDSPIAGISEQIREIEGQEDTEFNRKRIGFLKRTRQRLFGQRAEQNAGVEGEQGSEDPLVTGVQKLQEGLPATDEELEAIAAKKQEQDEQLLNLERDKAEEINKIAKEGGEEKLSMMKKFFGLEEESTKKKNKALIDSEKTTFSDLNELATAFGNENKIINKGFALANAAINIAEGITKAQGLGFPANIIEAARVVGVGITQTGIIKGAAQGGIVSGFDTGRDNQMMAVRSGEMIVPPDLVSPLLPTLRDIVRNEDQVGGSGSSGGGSVQVEFVGDAARLLKQIDREAAQAGLIV